MFSPAQLRAIFTLALVAVAVQASWFDDFLGRRQENGIARQYIRQDSGGGLLGSVIGGFTSGLGSNPTDGSSSSDTSSSPTSGSSATSQSSSSSTTPPTSSPSSSSSQSSSSSPSVSSTPTSTSSHSQTSSDSRVTTSPGSTTVVLQTTTVDGKVTTKSSTSTSPGSTTTGALQDGSSNKSTGMSSKTKTTVIGVVVGIGGFAVVIGLLIVAWRIWGRKKTEEEGDELMSNYGREKESSASGSTSNPFQSTLDQYHNPSRNVNPSANF